MKIAYIILCHKNLEQTRLLINQLNNGLCDFYVHIDKKSNDCDFDLPNVYKVSEKERVDVKWAHISVVYATINAMKLIKTVGKKYDYVFLISGQDFPIKSNVEIQEYLAQNYGSNFIEILDKKSLEYARYSKRNSLKYDEFLMERRFLSKALKKLLIIVTGGQTRTFKIFKRKNTLCVDFEFGSQWWVFTFECFEWILNHIESNAQYLEYYKNCLTPDESFFQTLFMLSPFKSTRKDFLTYLEWGANKNNPRIILEKDIDMLLKLDDKVFARKFDISIDSNTITLLRSKLKE